MPSGCGTRGSPSSTATHAGRRRRRSSPTSACPRNRPRRTSPRRRSTASAAGPGIPGDDGAPRRGHDRACQAEIQRGNDPEIKALARSIVAEYDARARRDINRALARFSRPRRPRQERFSASASASSGRGLAAGLAGRAEVEDELARLVRVGDQHAALAVGEVADPHVGASPPARARRTAGPEPGHHDRLARRGADRKPRSRSPPQVVVDLRAQHGEVPRAVRVPDGRRHGSGEQRPRSPTAARAAGERRTAAPIPPPASTSSSVAGTSR